MDMTFIDLTSRAVFSYPDARTTGMADGASIEAAVIGPVQFDGCGNPAPGALLAGSISMHAGLYATVPGFGNGPCSVFKDDPSETDM